MLDLVQYILRRFCYNVYESLSEYDGKLIPQRRNGTLLPGHEDSPLFGVVMPTSKVPSFRYLTNSRLCG
jgi:hypothetical protein